MADLFNFKEGIMYLIKAAERGTCNRCVRFFETGYYLYLKIEKMREKHLCLRCIKEMDTEFESPLSSSFIQRNSQVVEVVDPWTNSDRRVFASIRDMLDPDDLRGALEEDRNAVNARHDWEGYTPLHMAVSKGMFSYAQTLMEFGADINATDMSGNTPLHLATSVIQGPAEVRPVVQMLEYGADIHARNSEHLTPVRKAILAGEFFAAGTILSAVKDRYNRFYTAAGEEMARETTPSGRHAHNNALEIRNYITGYQQNLQDNILGDQGLLHRAVEIGDLSLVDELLRMGAGTNTGDLYGWTPLHHAVLHGHRHICDSLVQKGGRVYPATATGETLLHFAALCDREEMTEYFISTLLDARLNVNARNRKGVTACQVARINRNKTAVALLSQR